MAYLYRVRGAAALSVVGRVFLFVGLAGLAMAFYFANAEWHSRHSATASGKIVAVGSLPAIEFTMPDGSIVRFTNMVRSSSWHVGDAVAIAYDPANPSDAVVDGFAGRWFKAGLAGLLGGIFFLVGLAMRIVGRRALHKR